MSATATIRSLDQPGDLGWVVLAHGEVYQHEFGWDNTFEPMVASYVADYATRSDQSRQAGWIAEVDGDRVGCIFCEPARHPDDRTTAQIRMLVVRPDGRGFGLGRRLVDTCLDFARANGYQRMRLWTTDVLTAARRLYVDAGFELVDEQPQRRFGVDLVGMTYERDLIPVPAPG